MGGTVIGACTQTPDKIAKGWQDPNKPTASVAEVVKTPYHHDQDGSLSKAIGVTIETDPEGNTAFAGSPAKKAEYPAGMSQPGCVVFSASGERLFEWFHPVGKTMAVDPKGPGGKSPGGMLGNGALSRVNPDDVVSIVKDRLAGQAPSIKDARVDDQSKISAANAAFFKAARAKAKAKL